MECERVVSRVIEDIRKKGDYALIYYVGKYDRYEIKDRKLFLKHEEIEDYKNRIPEDFLIYFKEMKKNIEKFAHRTRLESWEYEDDEVRFGEKVLPVEKLGVYVPGGKYPLVSSLFMAFVPAKIAGCKEIIVATPPYPCDIILYACAFLGVEKILLAGGAQAIAALAIGTESIPKVDKIVGPGNIYVSTAKKLLFGEIDIDMIAGPTELVILSEGIMPCEWCVYDLLAQAEHDEFAESILICTEKEYIRKIEEFIKNKVIYGKVRFINVKDIDEGIDMLNEIAPEHALIDVREPYRVLDKIENCGCVFVGSLTSPSYGDYGSGPNHILPTSKTSRFFSALTVRDFQKAISYLEVKKKGLVRARNLAWFFAEKEGLLYHKKSAEVRE